MYSVNVTKIIENFKLEVICDCTIMESKNVDIIEVNRPGLQLAGYLGYFFPHRIQLLGKMEMSYLGSLSPKERYERIDKWIDKNMPCIVISRNLDVYDELMDLAKIYQVPLLRTNEMTSRFLAALISYLNVEIAERISIHGEFLEVHGEGILITGESGVGKSETALELVKRGHRLIADDVVEIRKVSENTLLGTSPEIIRHFIELRGIGIVDVKSLYGVGSVKKIDSINMVVNLEFWDENKKYDRMGVEQNFKDILGIKIPYYVIPVRPGRNLAIILEVAAMKSRQISMGYNAAKVLNDRIEQKFKGGK
ncbi:MAG: HPr(Ser) kinase/phosphatase [Clostridia bacterium]|nr:HPr(Ser) kinase/phosphatase [Clostridia bacterium]